MSLKEEAIERFDSKIVHEILQFFIHFGTPLALTFLLHDFTIRHYGLINWNSRTAIRIIEQEKDTNGKKYSNEYGKTQQYLSDDISHFRYL